ncbi:hypothetical protein [Sporosarcina sp. SG10008]|uniref:hypothetical protein n=1 Tax=Sporosarcina sp. SG10008 TaxID=3373103 RepID=UPI0037DD0B49
MKHDIYTVKRAINGDDRAFEELLFQEEKMLYYKALSFVGKKGGLLVTLSFKRRQLGGGPKANWLKGLSSIMLVIREG